METMKQIKALHKKANAERMALGLSGLSLKAFAKEAEKLEAVKNAHKKANQPRSEKTETTTRAATAANRLARHKRAGKAPKAS